MIVQHLSDINTRYLSRIPLLSVYLPLLLSLIVGWAAAVLITDQDWYMVTALIGLVSSPILVKLFLNQPFSAVLLWFLLYPIFLRYPGMMARHAGKLLHQAMIPATILLVLLAIILGLRQRKSLKIGIADAAMLLFLLIGVLNILVLTPDPQRALFKFYFRLAIPFAFYWLIRLIDPKAAEFRYLVWAAVPVLLIQAAIGLLSWFAPDVIPQWWTYRAGTRTTGTVGNPAVFTLIMVFCAMFLFHYATQVSSRLVRIMLFALVSLAFFCIFFSFSRGSWLGGILVWLGLLLIYWRFTWRLTVVTALLVIPLCVTLLSGHIAWARERLLTEETAQGRLLGGNATWGMIKVKPLFGWGFDTHDLYDEQFRTRVLDLAVNSEHSSHQTYLLITAEMGLVGLVPYMFPIIWWLVQSIRKWRYLPDTGFQNKRWLALLWLIMLQYFVVSNFTEMIHSNFFGTTIWWLTLGFIANLLQPDSGLKVPVGQSGQNGQAAHYHSLRSLT
jgi:O-antigen ligase